MMVTRPVLEKTQAGVESLARLIQQHLEQHAEGVWRKGDIEEFVTLTEVFAEMLKTIWEGFLTRLGKGLDSEKSRTVGAAMSLATTGWINVVQQLHDVGAKIATNGGIPPAWVVELDRERKVIEEIRTSARQIVNAVNAAYAAPLDQGMLAQSEADFAEGRYRTGKEVSDSLRHPK